MQEEENEEEANVDDEAEGDEAEGDEEEEEEEAKAEEAGGEEEEHEDEEHEEQAHQVAFARELKCVGEADGVREKGKHLAQNEGDAEEEDDDEEEEEEKQAAAEALLRVATGENPKGFLADRQAFGSVSPANCKLFRQNSRKSPDSSNSC